MALFDTSKGPTIALVGPDAGGKSTLGRRLADELRKEGHLVTLTREPGGSPGAEDIRRLLREGEIDRWSPMTETLLFMAARRDHLEKTIWPARALGEIVISDRYLDDTRAYQWTKDNRLEEPIEQIIKLTGVPEADLTILVDVDLNVAAERIAKASERTGDRFEAMDVLEKRTVRGRYLVLAEKYKHRMTIVDGNQSAEDLYRDVRLLVKQKLAL
jgi:dTMP kinase